MDASLLSTPSAEMSRTEVSRRTVAAWAAGIRVITLLAMPSSLSHFPGEATSKTNGGTSEARRKSRPASFEMTVVSEVVLSETRTSGSSGTGVRIIEPEMVRVPEGWFGMGCETGRDDEKPLHRVWVDAFDLAAHQVTNEEYGCFLAATNAAPPQFWKDASFNHPKMPVVAVSWHEAVAYCDWLSHATRKLYRLPTEAEWERAARGGAEGLAYPWGDAPPETLPDYGKRW